MTLAAHYDALLSGDRLVAPDGPLGDLPVPEVRRRFVALDGALPDPAGTMVTTGVGMTGPPHLGTVAQMVTARRLQRAGLDVQFVVADYEPYAGGRTHEAVRALAARYRALLEHLGFDPDRGVCRPQIGAPASRAALERAALLAPHYDDAVWNGDSDSPETAFTQGLEEAYEQAGAEATGPTSDAAHTLSGLLHLADFLLPLTDWGYDRVLVVFGADSTGLCPAGRRLGDRAGVEGRLDGLYTRLIAGTDGVPKMSKSVPGSGVDLSMAPETVRERVLGLPDEGVESPGAAALALLSPRTGALPDPGTAARGDARRAVADRMAALARRWGASCGKITAVSPRTIIFRDREPQI